MKMSLMLFLIFSCFPAFSGDRIFSKRKFDFSKEKLFFKDSQRNIPYFEEASHQLTKDWQNILSPTSVRIPLSQMHKNYFRQQVGGSFEQIKLSFSLNPAYNPLEIASINSEFDRISSELIECAGSMTVSQYYLNYKFKNCPQLKEQLELQKYRVFSLLLNSPINGDHRNELMDKKLVSSQLKREQDLKVSNVINNYPYNTDYFFRKELSSYLPLEPRAFNPLFVQSLIEFSSFNIYPMVFSSNFKLQVGDILEESNFRLFGPNKTNLNRSKVLSTLVEESFYSQLRIGNDEYAEKILGLTETQKNFLKSIMSEDNYEAITSGPTMREKTQGNWGQFPRQLQRVLRVVHNSYRLLANISFFTAPESFGMFPVAAASYFSSITSPGKWDYDLIGPYPGIISLNLSGTTDYTFCDCYRVLALAEHLPAYRQIDPWRFFVRDLFMNINSLEFDDE